MNRKTLFQICVGFALVAFGIYVMLGRATWVPGIALAGLGVLSLLWPCHSWIDRRLRYLITLDFRKLIVIGLAAMLVGIGAATGAAFNALDERNSNLLSLFAGCLSLILTLGGVVLAVYSIKGYLDRPASILDVLYRLAKMIKDVNEDENRSNRGGNRAQGFWLFMGDYPGIGALSVFQDHAESATAKELDDWDGWLRFHYRKPLIDRYQDLPKMLWRLIGVIPPSKDMEERVRKHGEASLFSQKTITAAVNFNRHFVEELLDEKEGEKGKGARCKALRIAKEQVPGYQIVVCGTYEKYNGAIIPTDLPPVLSR